jgi:hypothetical protein
MKKRAVTGHKAVKHPYPNKQNNQKKEEHKQVKKPNIKHYLVLFGSIIALFVIILIFLNQNKFDQDSIGAEKKASVKDLLITEKTDSDLAFVSFKVYNTYKEPAECNVTISISNKKYSSFYRVIIAPESNRQLNRTITMPNGDSKINVYADCIWGFEDQDITGCENTSLKICSIFKNDSRLKQCIISRPISEQLFCIALIKNNSNYCRYITYTEQQTRCRAFIENKPELCEETGSIRDWCYQDYGINKRNFLICDKVKDYEKRMSCLGATMKNPAMCEKLNENDKFICIINLAEYTKNKQLCEMLSGDYKTECYGELNSILK